MKTDGAGSMVGTQLYYSRPKTKRGWTRQSVRHAEGRFLWILWLDVGNESRSTPDLDELADGMTFPELQGNKWKEKHT